MDERIPSNLMRMQYWHDHSHGTEFRGWEHFQGCPYMTIPPALVTVHASSLDLCMEMVRGRLWTWRQTAHCAIEGTEEGQRTSGIIQ